MTERPGFRHLAAFLAAAAMLSACGGGGGSDTTNGDTTGGTGGTSRPTPGQQTASCSLTYSLTSLPAQGSGTDPRLAQQWHLQAAGTNAQAVWAGGNRGDGVRVTVVDDGVETVHEDLWPNVLAGASYNYLDGSTAPLPCTSADSHGTAVAGIAAARDANGLGGAGVAPRAALSALNALAGGTSADIADAMSRGAASGGVVNNSWGSPDDGNLHPADPAWEQSVLAGLRTGRGGLGLAYFSAAGNGGVIDLQGVAVAGVDNSNFDGYVNKLGINAVCAVNRNGQLPSYAEPGANLLVCGPSGGIVTTDIRNGYRTDFSGTSAATPMASGVAALVLKARPDLSWRDVRLILAQSARNDNPSDASWLPSALPGKRFSHSYGYGTVDAPAAVALAAAWQSVGGSASLVSCGPFASAPNRSIPDAGGTVQSPAAGATVSDTIAVAAAQCGIGRIEFIEVSFTSNHPYPADLAITLVSPAGRASKLASTRGCGTGLAASANPCRTPYTGWRFGSVRHLDEAAQGAWRLDVTDGLPGDAGSLQSWSLQLWGR